VWRIVLNITVKQPHAGDKGRFSSLGFGRRTLRKYVACYKILQTAQDFDGYLVGGKRRTNYEIWNVRGPTGKAHSSE
jgi:hypothetical protein